MNKAPGRLRLGAALCCSVLLHALVLHARFPAWPPRAGERHDGPLLITLAPAGRAVLPEAVRREEGKPAAERPSFAPRAAARREQSELKGAAAPARPRHGVSVSLGPASEPRPLPVSALGDASAYLAAGLTRYPAALGEFRAEFPPGRLQQRRGAEVVIQVMIDEKGRVVEALPVPGAPEDFAQAALRAVKRTRFQPAEAQGRPVKARAYFAVSFVVE